jgi:hypothetical protein
MQLLDSKSLLAKLMATENLVVEQRKVVTASFDVKSRVLVIPQLDKNISGYLYDLFVGHEVGHALFTPMDGLLKARDLKLPMSVTNVVEDSRIERKIKYKYPGLRSSFVKAYKELLEKDFFGTQGVDLNTLPFLDRMNLFCKGGPAQGIKFSDYEKQLVEMVETTETYDDVIRVSKLISQYAKEEKEAKRQQMLEEGVMDEEDELTESEYDGEDGEDGEFEYDNWDNENDGGEGEDDTEASSGEGESDDEEDNNKDQSSPSGTSGGHQGENDETEIRSLTDENYKKNESKLFAKDEGTYYYGNIPDVDLSKAILDYKSVFKTYREDTKHITQNENLFSKFRNDTNKVVNYMVKEFELRKNADQLKRTSVAKTGELNMSKVFSYNFNDDIFKKISITPNGKSHGLVMFLDWSGSMSNHLENTIKQLITLVMFCKKVNIPYEVYAFSSEALDLYSGTPKSGDIEIRPFKLLNIFSSRMSAIEFSYASNVMIRTATARYSYCHLFAMGGTPLNETIISAMKIVPEFQKKYKLQVVNTIFLTDGEGHRLDSVYREFEGGRLHSCRGNIDDSYSYGASKNLIIRDPITKHQFMPEDSSCTKVTSAFIKTLKARTNCNILGFYVLSGREFSRAAYILLPKAANVDDMRVKFRKEKSLTITSAGFDEYYLLRSEGLDVDDDVEFTVKENTTTRGLVSAFSKYTKNRLLNRVVLNRFIGMIA